MMEFPIMEIQIFFLYNKLQWRKHGIDSKISQIKKIDYK